MDTDRDKDRDRTGTATGMGTWTGMVKGARTGKQKGTGTFLQGMRPQGTTFEFEYLGEFENNRRYDSGVHMGLIHEKKKIQKSCATVPLQSS
jgi:hypothetical protein